MAFVYILKSKKNGKYYIGSTNDYEKRLQQHNSGNVTFTKGIRPLELKLVQKYLTIRDARKIENKLKGLKRKDYIDKIVKEGFIKLGL